jgi:hypothetical protein
LPAPQRAANDCGASLRRSELAGEYAAKPDVEMVGSRPSFANRLSEFGPLVTAIACRSAGRGGLEAPADPERASHPTIEPETRSHLVHPFDGVDVAFRSPQQFFRRGPREHPEVLRRQGHSPGRIECAGAARSYQTRAWTPRKFAQSRKFRALLQFCKWPATNLTIAPPETRASPINRSTKYLTGIGSAQNLCCK